MFARCVSILAVLLCWPVIGLAAMVKPRPRREDHR